VNATKGSRWPWLRVALVAFVLIWILGPRPLRESVPILLVFLLALGLEIQFLVSALRGGGPSRAPDRGPQPVDREWYGFDGQETEDEDEEWDEEQDDEDDGGGWSRTAPRARPLRSFATGIAVITALVVAVVLLGRDTGWAAIPGERRAEAVARYSDEASRIAEKPVTIRCDEGRDYVGAVQHADGVAVVGGELAILTPEICNDLYRLAFEHETNGVHTGRALAVLAHESWHLRGEADESTAECYALQSGVTLGERLGLTEGRALQLMREQRIENALRGADTLEYRLTSECRDGGRLDLDPASSPFP
jgi:hypothetical protein